MTVTERLMAPGTWNINLHPDTPKAVRDICNLESNAFGHIAIFPGPVKVDEYDDADLLSLARYVGIFRTAPAGGAMSGPGLLAWLGDEDGKGDALSSSVDGTSGTYTDQSFQAWVDELLPSSITAGDLSSIAGTFVHTFPAPVMPRSALDDVMAYFGGEYRVNPDFTLDAGAESDLFVTTPTAVVTRRTSGHDPVVRGLEASTLQRGADAADFSTSVVVVAEGAGGSVARGNAATSSPSIPYYDPQGNKVNVVRLVSSPDTGADNADAVAQVQLNRFSSVKDALTVSSRDYDIRGAIAPGDTIYVYDPDEGLTDPTNEVHYRGQILYPVARRVQGVTWPIREGLGVAFRYYDGASFAWLDLTPYVVWEQDTMDTSLDVGTSPRRLATTPGEQARSAIADRLALLRWQPYTPTWTSDGTAPSIGNGSIEGRYVQIGNLVICSIYLLAGSTTSFGTGNYSLSLPVQPRDAGGSGNAGAALSLTQRAFLRDESGGTNYNDFSPYVYATTGTGLLRLRRNTTLAYWSRTAPFTMAQSDHLRTILIYEAAE